MTCILQAQTDNTKPANDALLEACIWPDKSRGIALLAVRVEEAFDFVLYAGILYHVTDPILALRITFKCLKDIGRYLPETDSEDSKESVVGYQGAGGVGPELEQALNRGGWNWFLPSPGALCRVMCEVTVSEVIAARAFLVGTRHRYVEMTRGGYPIRATRQRL